MKHLCQEPHHYNIQRPSAGRPRDLLLNHKAAFQELASTGHKLLTGIERSVSQDAHCDHVDQHSDRSARKLPMIIFLALTLHTLTIRALCLGDLAVLCCREGETHKPQPLCAQNHVWEDDDSVARLSEQYLVACDKLTDWNRFLHGLGTNVRRSREGNLRLNLHHQSDLLTRVAGHRQRAVVIKWMQCHSFMTAVCHSQRSQGMISMTLAVTQPRSCRFSIA